MDRGDSLQEKGGRGGVGAVLHAVRILRHLAGQGAPSGATAIARATGINPSTCFNILRTLAAERLVVFDPAAKTYRLGLGMLELSLGLLGTNAPDLIRPELDRLALNYNALLALWQVTDGERIVLIDRVFATTAVRVDMRIGTRMPASSGAVGRCIAAARGLSAEELRRRFVGLRWQRPMDFEQWHAEVRATAKAGYALDRGQLFKGVDAVAAAVVDGDGRPRFGISAIAIADQVPADALHRLGEEIRDAARRVGQALFPLRSE